MKKLTLIVAISLISFLTFAKIVTEHLAKPDEVEGYKIFLMSKPVDDYEKLGYLKIGMSWSGKPKELINTLLKKAKKDYPTGDAILISNIEMDEAMVIKFK